MRTVAIRCGNYVRFVITNHPEYRVAKLQEVMPPGCLLTILVETSQKVKDIKLRFADRQVGGSVWYTLDEEFEQFLTTLTLL